MIRSKFSLCLLSSLAAGFFVSSLAVAESTRAPAAEIVPLRVTVYKSPTCDCCSRWETHLRKNGFTVESHPTTDMVAVKSEHHVPLKARSCHTAIVEGYVIEGHVPADAIKRLLKERPTGVMGLAVPRMPIGSPGMEGPDPEHYDILSFDMKGKTKVFEER